MNADLDFKRGSKRQHCDALCVCFASSAAVHVLVGDERITTLLLQR